MTEIELCQKLFNVLTSCGTESELYKHLFLRDVLKATPMDADEIRTMQIYREYTVDNRQMDLAIETARRLIPIEVKIESRNRYDQCFDCFRTAKTHTDDSLETRMYYLTPFRQRADDNSRFNLPFIKNSLTDTGDGIVLLGFGNEILTWLNNCLNETKTELFREVISSLIDEIKNIAKLKAAFDADTRALYEILMLEIFEAIDNKLGENFCTKYNLSKIASNDSVWKDSFAWNGSTNSNDYRFNIENYYDSVYITLPSIYFRYNGVNWRRRGFEIWFFVSLDDNALTAGWMLFDLKLKRRCDNIPDKTLAELKKKFPKDKIMNDTDILICKNLPISKKYNRLTFTVKNDAVDSLLDDKNLAAAIDFMMPIIKDVASKIN